MSWLARGVALIALVVVSAAQSPQAPPGLLERCAFDSALTVEMPQFLVEISGLAATAEGRLLAHADDQARIAELDPATLQIVREFRLRNSPRDDFEGVAVTPRGVVLMTSTGWLYLVNDQEMGSDRGGDDVGQYSFERIDTGFGRGCELEGLGYDANTDVLLIPCKNPRDPRYMNAFVVFRWSLAERAPADPRQLAGSRSRVARALRTTELRATSVEWDSATGHFLVLSSQPQAIVELGADGALIRAIHLPPGRHLQPEGLTRVGDRLLIADEGVGRSGTITAYLCRP